LAGANLIYGPGMTESGVTIDYAQLVIDDEFARMIKQVVAGIPVGDVTLAVDDIHAVGPFGDFLSVDATMKHMRAQSQPKLMDRRVREDWEALGAPTMYDTARAAAARILAEHRPAPLPDEVVTQIRRIVDQADRELAGA
jgi:trimethylamine--corrinoid protein Co-methyltransferase